MAFTYDPGLSSSRDWIRLLSGDTNSDGALFQDAELDGLLAAKSTLSGQQLYYDVAATALELLTTRFMSTGRGFGEESMSDDDIRRVFAPDKIAQLRLLADRYRQIALEASTQGLTRLRAIRVHKATA